MHQRVKVKFTVLGGSGFIGSHLSQHLADSGYETFVPKRNDPSVYSKDLGHVIYCIGLTADFREHPFETIEAHVCMLTQILQKATFDSLLYLSSTRVYRLSSSGNEDSLLQMNSQDPDKLYDLSKLMGEAVCFAYGNPRTRVARLSNVYGRDYESPNFLASIIREAIEHKKVVLKTSLDSTKDYVCIDDVVQILPKISLSGKHRLYNVASGLNVNNERLIRLLTQTTRCQIEVMQNACDIHFPPVDITRVREEFNFSPRQIEGTFVELTRQYMKLHQGALS